MRTPLNAVSILSLLHNVRLRPIAGLGTHKRKRHFRWKCLSSLCFVLARPERFERPTLWFVARYSIQLSYGCAVNTTVLWRRKRDSNPRYRFKPVCFLSREVPSTTRPFLRFERSELYAHSPLTSTTQAQNFRINFVPDLNRKLYAAHALPTQGIFHQSKQRL